MTALAAVASEAEAREESERETAAQWAAEMEAAFQQGVEARAAAVEAELRRAQEAQLLGMLRSWKQVDARGGTLEEHLEVLGGTAVVGTRSGSGT